MADESPQTDYTSADLKHLSDRDHVRERFGMYIGDNTARGLHHLVYEVVDNSIDECMANYAKHISVIVNVDGSVTVEDDGRGIPTDRHPQLSEEMDREVSTLEGVMTVLKFGGKFEKGAYQTSGGLHGVGVTVVNFLSEWCEVEVNREGHVWQQEYQRGEPTGPVRKMGTTSRTGTKTTFKPDPQIFPQTKFSWDILARRLQELAFLNSGVRITFSDAVSGQKEEYYYERGVVEFIEWLNRSSDAVHSDVISIRGEGDGVSWDIAMQYTTEYTENIHSYVNNITTSEGGTHVSGFRSALTRTLNAYGKKSGIYKDLVPTGEDVREGLTTVLSVRVPHPQFEGQTKTKLGNGEVEGIINSAVGDYLSKYLEENPKSAKAILQKGVLAAEARTAALKAKALLRERKGALSGGGLPGKLRDCTSRNVAICEIYLVEGDSAGGSAEGGRRREFQAILPLRGKIINAYKSRDDKVLANEEVRSVISALGAGIGADADIGKRRYNKVVIMTDADVDGSHIRTLLLTFFYRQMYQLVAAGHVYVAQPPLFRVRTKKQTYYVQTEDEMKTQLLDQGLGEGVFMPGDGREIAGEDMHKLCRTLSGLEDALVALEKRGISLRDHLARREAKSGKLPMYHVYYGIEEHWFTSRDQLETFVQKKEKSSGGELAVGRPEEELTDATPGTAADTGADQLVVVDLHEVRSINAGLKEIETMGFGTESLLPQDRTGSEDPRYKLRRGDSEIGLEDLRSLLSAVRRAGEKGLSITRFKGLGEMNAEELRDTTLDPVNRTLLRVTMNDAAAADDLFRVLMGEKVEPRREFIERHALDVKHLDV
ncbi:MAG: DNA gyrase subunit B [Planctomycetota bacterium]